MGECDITVNIQMRKNELIQFADRLNNITTEFDDLKQADVDFMGDQASEDRIKIMIKKIDQMISKSVQDLQRHDGFQAETLEKYAQSDF